VGVAVGVEVGEGLAEGDGAGEGADGKAGVGVAGGEAKAALSSVTGVACAWANEAGGR
jgi:hypothetical protein